MTVVIIFVLLFIFLIVSVIGNILLFKNAEFWKNSSDINEKRIVEFKSLTESVYKKMTELDSEELFQKDDSVGVLFSDIVNIIKWFHEFVKDETSDSMDTDVDLEK